MEDIKRVSLRMDEDLHFKLRKRSFLKDISMNDIMLEALEEYFEKLEEKEEKEKEEE